MFDQLISLCQETSPGKWPSARELLGELERFELATQARLLEGGAARPHVSRALAPPQPLLDEGAPSEDRVHFVGRAFVLRALERFAEQRATQGKGGIFILEAPVGAGKTALLSAWAERWRAGALGVSLHAVGGRVSSELLSSSLWAQFSERFALSSARETADWKLALEARLAELSGKGLPGGRLLLLIDALDRAEDSEQTASNLPTRLPPGVVLVVATRPPGPGQDFLRPLLAAGAMKCELSLDSQESLADLRTYLQRRLSWLPGAEAALAQLAGVCGGSFLLAALATRSVREGAWALPELLEHQADWNGLDPAERLQAYHRWAWEVNQQRVQTECWGELAEMLGAARNWLSEWQLLGLLREWEPKRTGQRSRWEAGTLARAFAALGCLVERRTWEQQGRVAALCRSGWREPPLAWDRSVVPEEIRDCLCGRPTADKRLRPVHASIAEHYRRQAADLNDGPSIDPYGRAHAAAHACSARPPEFLAPALPDTKFPDDTKLPPLAPPEKAGTVPPVRSMDTSASLLERLRSPASEAALAHLDRLYRPLIRAWVARDPRLASAADELAREIMSVVCQELPGFQRQRTGSFRQWLRTITADRVQAHYRQCQTQPLALGHLTDEPGILSQLAEDASEAARQWDYDHDRFVVTRLLELLAGEFGESNVLAFRRVVLQEVAVAEVATELGLTVADVLIAKAHLLKRLRKEAEGLLD